MSILIPIFMTFMLIYLIVNTIKEPDYYIIVLIFPVGCTIAAWILYFLQFQIQDLMKTIK